MTNVEELRRRVQNNGMAANLQVQNGSQSGNQSTMTQKVADAIKSEGEKLKKQKTEGLELKSVSEMEMPEQNNARQDEPEAPAQEFNQGDGLEKMIREAKLQTDALQSSLVGADAQLAGSAAKLKTAAALAPQTEEQEKWKDTSYLTPNPTTGETRTGRPIAEGAGGIVTDAAGNEWMILRDGGMQDVTQKSAADRDMLKQQQLDNSYQMTGRVYSLNPDGSTPQWLSVGDQVVTAGGTYVVTGHKDGGGYTSELYDPNKTTASFQGNYNTGTYGSIIGQQNGNVDDFRGNRQSNGAYSGYGGYSMNQNGKMQFDTVSHTFDGNWTRAAIQDGVAYELDAGGNLKPMEAGSLVQDASQRYWVVGADGSMIDVTPADPKNNPLNDPTGEVGRIQREEAEKAGLNLNRGKEENEAILDPATQAEIDRLRYELEREQAAAEAANRNLYREYRLGQERLKDQLVGAGLNTSGVSEKVQAQLTADYLSGMNANRQAVQTAEDDAEYRIQMAQLEAMQNAEAQRLAEAQQKAETLAKYGDFSGYYDLGYSGDQVNRMQQAYDRANAEDTTYQGLSDYAQTLLGLYQANPGYNIKAGLQQALDSGLITQTDYIAALQAAAGMAV